jgi:6-phosphofructo-2-kinase / fructose-2,6-biphosphatase 3
LQINTFHGKWQYLFIESICNDPKVLEANYLFKMLFSPDYKGMDVKKVGCPGTEV